jgi:hypothetical protein
VVSKSWTIEPGFSVNTTGRFEVEDFAKQIRWDGAIFLMIPGTSGFVPGYDRAVSPGQKPFGS